MTDIDWSTLKRDQDKWRERLWRETTTLFARYDWLELSVLNDDGSENRWESLRGDDGRSLDERMQQFTFILGMHGIPGQTIPRHPTFYS